eukprot:365647-Chlamydomonas_euryale.AAC.18
MPQFQYLRYALTSGEGSGPLPQRDSARLAFARQVAYFVSCTTCEDGEVDSTVRSRHTLRTRSTTMQCMRMRAQTSRAVSRRAVAYRRRVVALKARSDPAG